LLSPSYSSSFALTTSSFRTLARDAYPFPPSSEPGSVSPSLSTPVPASTSVPSSGSKEKERERRTLFTPQELTTIRRNAEQLLALHEEFVAALAGALSPINIVLGANGTWAGLGNGTEPGRDPKLKGDDVDTKLEAAIVAVTTVFTTQVCAAVL